MQMENPFLPSKDTCTLFLWDRDVLSEGLLKDVAKLSPDVGEGLLSVRRVIFAAGAHSAVAQ